MLYSYAGLVTVIVPPNPTQLEKIPTALQLCASTTHKINGIIDVSHHHWMPEQRIKEYIVRTENVNEDSLTNFEIKPVPQI